MKQIKKVVLKEATRLSQEEMKHVFGGSGLESESGACAGVKDDPESACVGKAEWDSCSFCILSGTQYENLIRGYCKKPTGSVVEVHKKMYCYNPR